MFETLKKIGVPTAFATVIVLLVMVVPFLFKIDERYAKQAALEAEVSRLENKNADLARELAQAAGFQQAMIAILKQQAPPPPPPALLRIPPRVSSVPSSVIVPPPPAPIEAAPPSPPPAPLEQPKNWKDLSAGLLRQQQRLIKE
jgi:hypothetical protein